MPMVNANALQRPTIAKDVLSTLRYEIITGKLKDGEYLGEVAISQRMHVSRGPVRSAIQQLVADGLAVSLENGRTRVVSLTERDIEDIYELRVQLEKKAANLLIQSDLTACMPLLDILNQMKEENDKGESCNSVKMADLGYEVHVCMMQNCGNKAIWNAWKSMAAILKAIMDLNSEAVDNERAFLSHKELIETIVQKQPDADKVIERHLLQDSKDIWYQLSNRTI